jgi:hypothetical protein
MSQHTARYDQHARREDEDVADRQARQPEREQGAHPRQPVAQPPADGGMSPDEPDEGEFELIGDDDLGAADLGPADLGPADLGPAAPNFRDPDAGSGRIRKITRESGRDTGTR